MPHLFRLGLNATLDMLAGIRTVREDLTPLLAANQPINPHVEKQMILYSAISPAVFGRTLSEIHDRPLLPEEKKRGCLATALTFSYDALFDSRSEADTAHITDLVFGSNPEPRTPMERLTNDLWYGVLSTMTPTHRTYLEDIAREVHHAQIYAEMQKERKTNIDDIRTITRQKGGLSGVFLAASFIPLEKMTYDLFFARGHFLQILDDIRDRGEDINMGVRTLATELPRAELILELNTAKRRLWQAVNQLHIPHNKKERLLYSMHALSFVYADGFSALSPPLSKRYSRMCRFIKYIRAYDPHFCPAINP